MPDVKNRQSIRELHRFRHEERERERERAMYRTEREREREIGLIYRVEARRICRRKGEENVQSETTEGRRRLSIFLSPNDQTFVFS